MKSILLALVAIVIALNLNAANATASVNGATIPIVDCVSVSWTMNAAGQVVRNGTPDTTTSKVQSLLLWNCGLYQYATSGAPWTGWYLAGSTIGKWTGPQADPRTSSSSSSGGGSSSSGSSTSSSSSGGSSSSSSGASSSSSSSSSGGPAPDGLKVCGTALCDTITGAKKTILGDELSGLETNFAPVRSAVIAAYNFSTWGTQHSGENLVRFHLDACAVLNDQTCAPGTDGKNWAQLQQATAHARAAGYFVEFDEAWSAPSGKKSLGQSGWPDATHSLALWKLLADTYKGDPGVIFEPFNEPFGANVYAQWVVQNGSTFTPGTDGAYLANGGGYVPFCQQNNSNANAMQCSTDTGKSWSDPSFVYQVAGQDWIIATIRGEGAPNLILSSPVGWAGEIETALGTGVCATDLLKNCGYSMHAYGYNKGLSYPQAVIAAGYPLVVTEFQGTAAGIGSLGSLSTVLNAGFSGAIHCCANAWNNTSISLTPW